MSDTPESATEALKRALAAKKKAGNPHGGLQGSPRAEEKAQQARSVALAKPAFRKASKRG